MVLQLAAYVAIWSSQQTAHCFPGTLFSWCVPLVANWHAWNWIPGFPLSWTMERRWAEPWHPLTCSEPQWPVGSQLIVQRRPWDPPYCWRLWKCGWGQSCSVVPIRPYNNEWRVSKGQQEYRSKQQEDENIESLGSQHWRSYTAHGLVCAIKVKGNFAKFGWRNKPKRYRLIYWYLIGLGKFSTCTVYEQFTASGSIAVNGVVASTYICFRRIDESTNWKAWYR